MLTSEKKSLITRTDRGLSIVGTRITLYDVMDYFPRYPVQFIRDLFDLTEEQIMSAIDYIQMHSVEVANEYQQVVQDAQELQQYYDEKNRDLIARISTQPMKPGQEAIYAKLNAEKMKFGMAA